MATIQEFETQMDELTESISAGIEEIKAHKNFRVPVREKRINPNPSSFGFIPQRKKIKITKTTQLNKKER